MTHLLEDPNEEKKKKRKKAEEINDVEDEDEIMDINETPPPDGGWGWAVVFASFMIHIVTDGVTYSFGVFYVELLHYFNEGNGTTAWIASILVGVTLCSGPVSSAFVNKYGCRTVTIAGALLASFCLLISVWAPNVFTLCLTIGIGTGLGFGLIYLPAIVCVTIYFEKLRSLATGIAVCGSGLGTLIFAPFIEYLIATYGWRGSMMITSALVLNCIIFGMVFRPVEPVKNKNIPLKEIKSSESTLKVLETNGVLKNGLNRPHSVNNVSTTYHFVSETNDNKKDRIRFATSQPILNKSVASHSGHYPHAEHGTKSFGSGIMNKRDIFYQGSVENIRKRSASVGYNENHIPIQGSLRSLPNGAEYKTSETTECLPHARKSLGILQQMLQLSLLKDPLFLLFVISNFCTSIGFNIPYIYLIPQAQERSIAKDTASYLLAVIGIANTVGRIVLGYVSDKPWINRLLVYNLCLTTCGLSTVLSAYCRSFISFVIYASVYGFTAGAYVGLTSVILVDLLGLEHLTNAFGLVLLFQGFASFLGPPIAGWLYDALKSYDPGFFVGGGLIAISGLILFFIPCIQRRLKRNEEKLKMITVPT
ncbi:monocarboxylate transporter 14 [Chelonus insularis]|uniref:monocarboxylate transporter 14 n=1 Tax=Chelonus insularis TaxID=460826 RepID=UPI00158F0525|nr:monocarboxylate transporter 14 [Chelonus insularis]XP_034949381.1 monocarboxylate transporter 14 [Chelonus insularis]